MLRSTLLEMMSNGTNFFLKQKKDIFSLIVFNMVLPFVNKGILIFSLKIWLDLSKKHHIQISFFPVMHARHTARFRVCLRLCRGFLPAPIPPTIQQTNHYYYWIHRFNANHNVTSVGTCSQVPCHQLSNKQATTFGLRDLTPTIAWNPGVLATSSHTTNFLTYKPLLTDSQI